MKGKQKLFTSVKFMIYWKTDSVLFHLWPLECTSWQKGAAHLISLVDSIDKLRAWGTPGKTHRGGVDSLGLYISWWHSGHWSRGRRKNRDREIEKVEADGQREKRKRENSDEIGEEKTWKCTAGTFRPALFRAWESGWRIFFILAHLGRQEHANQTGCESGCLRQLPGEPCSSLFEVSMDSDVTPENSQGVTH